MEADTEPAANEREEFPDRTRPENRAPFAAAALRSAYGYAQHPVVIPLRKAAKKRSGDDDTEAATRLQRDRIPARNASDPFSRIGIFRNSRALFLSLRAFRTARRPKRPPLNHEKTMEEKKTYRVLFVCLGNICRSPSAEAVFRGAVERAGLEDRIEIDSAGISGYHAGESADSRMTRHAAQRGYRLKSISRPVTTQDFDRFDLIVGMDDSNIRDLTRKASREEGRAEIRRMTDFCTQYDDTEVPDPYYGAAAGFERVLDLLEDACRGLLDYVRSRIDRP